MKWILIWVVFANGTSTGNVEFNDKVSCELAATTLKDAAPWGSKISTVCVKR
jgi:hypothetical protein